MVLEKFRVWVAGVRGAQIISRNSEPLLGVLDKSEDEIGDPARALPRRASVFRASRL